MAKALDRILDVTLVERQNYFTHTFGVLRALGNKAFAPLVLIPYDRLLRDGVVVRGEVTDISADSVTLNGPDGKPASPLPYDYLVVATGAAWAFPARPTATDARRAIEELEAANAALAAGSRVLVIGGGAVGAELAAEVVERASPLRPIPAPPPPPTPHPPPRCPAGPATPRPSPAAQRVRSDAPPRRPRAPLRRRPYPGPNRRPGWNR